MHQALTVIARVKPERAADLEATLDLIGGDIGGKRENNIIKLGDIETLQFGRWAMIPNQATGRMEHLLFTSNFDGPLRAHLNEFVDNHGAAMDAIWGCCEGYPQGRVENPARFKKQFRDFIRAHSYNYSAFYVGFHNERVGDKRAYVQLHEAMDDFFDLPTVRAVAEERLKGMENRTPMEVLRAFNDIPEAKQFYDNRLHRVLCDLPLTHDMPPKPNLKVVMRFVFDFVWMTAWMLVIRPLRNRITGREPALNLNLDDLSVQEGVTEIEDVVTQNQITVISRIKPGLWVWLKLNIVLIAIHLVGRYFNNQGALGGIATIHFARWAIIDNGRWLLFTSNYDGSWDSYIGDFVDKAASGMDLIWTSAPRYPKKGSRDIEAFKAIIRVNQVKTQVFYSAFPDRTIVNLINDGQMANGIHRDRAAEWLRRV